MQIIKWFFSLAIVTAIGLGIVYFLPTDIKSKALQKVSGIIPESIKAEAEKLVMTPPEERAEIISQIEDGMKKIKEEAPETAKDIVIKTEALLEDLKNKNGEESIAEIVKKKVIDSFFSNGTTTCDTK